VAGVDGEALVLAGITGHQSVANPSRTWRWIAREFRRLLVELDADVGASSLAEGTDQVFAEIVLALEMELIAIVPFEGYETRFGSAHGRRKYFELLGRASRVEILPSALTVEVGYLNAGMRVVEISDVLLAVWDGNPARGLGGTADIVEYALLRGVPIVHLNPDSLTTVALSRESQSAT
jgi:hypothetical protein